MLVNTIVIVANALAGLAVIGCAWPLMRQRIKPNGFYGVRIKPAFTNEKSWYAINAYGGRALVWAGLAVVVLAPVCVVADAERQPVFFTVLAMLPSVLPLTVALFATLRDFSTNPGRRSQNRFSS